MLMGMGVGVPFGSNLRGPGGDIALGQLTSLIASLGGSLYLPNVSNFENTTVAEGIDDAAELDDPIAYAGDLTTANLPENMLINSVFAGAVVGAPGTMPTGCLRSAENTSGVRQEIVGFGASYIDLRVYTPTTASATTSFVLLRRPFNEIVAKPGEIWSAGVNVALIAGTYTATKLKVTLAGYTAGSIYVENSEKNIAATSTDARFIVSRSLTGATTERATGYVFYAPTVGEVIDFTIRVSNIQLERGRARTYVPTTTAAISRGTFNPAFQATTANKPFLRSKDYSLAQWASATGETWSITNTAVADTAGIKWGDGEAYLRCPGVAGNVATTPDSAAASITGSLSIVARFTPDDWTPAAAQCIASKWALSGNKRSYRLDILTTGKLVLYASQDGTALTVNAASTEAVPETSGNYVRGSLTVNGANSVVQFFTSTNGTSWTQLGDDVSCSITGIYDSDYMVQVGASEYGNTLAGKIYYAAIYNNDTATGTPAVEFYPARDAIRPSAAAWDFDNSNDYLQTPINPTSSGYMCVAARQDEAIGSLNALIGAYKTSATIQAGVGLSVNTTGPVILIRTAADGTQSTAGTSTSVAAGNAFIADAEWEVTSAKVRLNGASQGTSATTKDAANTGTVLTIGARNQGTSAAPSPTDVFGGVIFGVVHIPGQTTGAELVTNGGFDSDTGWTKDTGWSIDSGVATKVVSASNANIYQSSSIVAGKTYSVTYTLALSAGGFIVFLGGTAGPTRLVSGTYTDTIIAGSSNDRIAMFGNAAFAGTVDNISVKEYIQPVSTADQATIRKLMGQIAGVSGVV